VSRRAPPEADWLKTFGASPAREIPLPRTSSYLCS
jgi:hypothetical protein